MGGKYDFGDPIDPKQFSNLDYDNEQNQIVATCKGSQRDLYSIKITLDGSRLNAYCTCYYEGVPCKHVVAVLLLFIRNKQTYVNRAEEDRDKLQNLKGSLINLSKTELVDFILGSARKSDDFKRDLFITFGDSPDAAIKIITSNIESVCATFEAGDENSNELSMKIRSISESVKNSNAKIRLQTAWAIVDKIIGFLNEYGIGDDEALEDLVFENLDIITELLAKEKKKQSARRTILKGLLRHYLRNNCGVMDYISEAIFKNCTEKSDYEILINETEKVHRDLKKEDSYHKDLAEDLLQDLENALANE